MSGVEDLVIPFTIDEYRLQDGDGKRRYWEWRKRARKEDLESYRKARNRRLLKLKLSPEEIKQQKKEYRQKNADKYRKRYLKKKLLGKS